MCIICPKLFVACKIHCKSPSRRPDGLTTLDWLTVHEANLSAYVRELAYLSHVRFGRVLLHVPQIFQRRKSDANKQDFEIWLNLTYRARSTPIMTKIKTKVFCTFGPNLVILAWNRWWVFAWTSSKWGEFWLWSYIWPWSSRSITPKTIGILTKVFYTYGPNWWS